MIQRKVCLIGVPAVGKTSLARRFVEGTFSEDYLTTIGVHISRRVVDTADGVDLDEPVKLIVWDLNGDDEFAPLQSSYVRGSAGVLLVADGARPETLDRALALHARLESEIGPLPAVVCLNKRDLPGWSLDAEAPELATYDVMETSAADGRGVEAAFAHLATLAPTAR